MSLLTQLYVVSLCCPDGESRPERLAVSTLCYLPHFPWEPSGAGRGCRLLRRAGTLDPSCKTPLPFVKALLSWRAHLPRLYLLIPFTVLEVFRFIGYCCEKNILTKAM